MHRRFGWTLLLLAACTAPAWAGEPGSPASAKKCCPECGSARVAGNEAAGVCLECGQVTILGLRPPFALAAGLLLAAGLGLIGYHFRGRLIRLGLRPGVGLAVLLAIAISAGSLLAAETEAVVVSYDKETMKLVVKEGEKERTVQLQKKTHVHYPDGNRLKEVKIEERPQYLKKGVKVVIEEENGKLVEINIKKEK